MTECGIRFAFLNIGGLVSGSVDGLLRLSLIDHSTARDYNCGH